MARKTGPLLAPRHKVWLTLDGEFLLGPNYLRFLRAVEESGTIRSAAKAAGWSYRTCLNRVRRMEEALGAPVLLTTRGGAAHGGAKLSPAAAHLLAVFADWREEMHRLAGRSFAAALRRHPGPVRRRS